MNNFAEKRTNLPFAFIQVNHFAYSTDFLLCNKLLFHIMKIIHVLSPTQSVLLQLMTLSSQELLYIQYDVFDIFCTFNTTDAHTVYTVPTTQSPF